MSRLYCFLLALLAVSGLQAQGPSRSGFPAEQEDKRFLRRFPCGGIEVLDQMFDADTFPATWATIDADGFTPRSVIQELTPIGGWQLVTDFKDADSINKVMASPSWYEGNQSPSDDYLITEQITLPSNPCLSWYAYSQDQLFPESYEIRVSTTTPDEAGFLANPPLLTVDAERDEFTYRSTSLAQYGEQTVYIAFRHTTDDGFILALDDIRIAQVEQRDIAMFSLNNFTSSPLDTIFFTGAVINKGLDTLLFDSLQLQISWQINTDPVQTIAVADSFSLLPNDTLQFRHDSAWVPPVSAAYRLRVWVSGVSMDGDIENDTISRFQAVGTATSLEDDLSAAMRVYPNPAIDRLEIQLSEQMAPQAELRLIGIRGEVILTEKIRNHQHVLQLPDLPAGMYFLVVEDINQKRAIRRVILE